MTVYPSDILITLDVYCHFYDHIYKPFKEELVYFPASYK